MQTGQEREFQMLRELDPDDYIAVVCLIRAAYLKVVYKREATNERKRRGASTQFHTVERITT